MPTGLWNKFQNGKTKFERYLTGYPANLVNLGQEPINIQTFLDALEEPVAVPHLKNYLQDRNTLLELALLQLKHNSLPPTKNLSSIRELIQIIRKMVEKCPELKEITQRSIPPLQLAIECCKDIPALFKEVNDQVVIKNMLIELISYNHFIQIDSKKLFSFIHACIPTSGFMAAVILDIVQETLNIINISDISELFKAYVPALILKYTSGGGRSLFEAVQLSISKWPDDKPSSIFRINLKWENLNNKRDISDYQEFISRKASQPNDEEWPNEEEEFEILMSIYGRAIFVVLPNGTIKNPEVIEKHTASPPIFVFYDNSRYHGLKSVYKYFPEGKYYFHYPKEEIFSQLEKLKEHRKKIINNICLTFFNVLKLNIHSEHNNFNIYFNTVKLMLESKNNPIKPIYWHSNHEEKINFTTVLHYAAKNSSPMIFELLLRYTNEDVLDITNSAGEKIWHCIFKRKNIVEHKIFIQLLLQHPNFNISIHGLDIIVATEDSDIKRLVEEAYRKLLTNVRAEITPSPNFFPTYSANSTTEPPPSKRQKLSEAATAPHIDTSLSGMVNF